MQTGQPRWEFVLNVYKLFVFFTTFFLMNTPFCKLLFNMGGHASHTWHLNLTQSSVSQQHSLYFKCSVVSCTSCHHIGQHCPKSFYTTAHTQSEEEESKITSKMFKNYIYTEVLILSLNFSNIGKQTIHSCTNLVKRLTS